MLIYRFTLRKPLYSQSAFGRGMDTSKQYDSSIRSSQSAILPVDPVVECLERRSLDFQGFLPSSQIENLQTVRYKVGDLFRPHYDWASTYEENPRFSTIFGYLLCDDCVGGETQFPNIEGRFSGKWCKFMDCGESADGAEVGGVGFKPLVGNAVFWTHYYSNGTGHPGVLHAGMPVRNGTKVGMNIMTRQKPGYS
jgi:prolyl 4-hydroxylase